MFDWTLIQSSSVLPWRRPIDQVGQDSIGDRVLTEVLDQAEVGTEAAAFACRSEDHITALLWRLARRDGALFANPERTRQRPAAQGERS